MRPTDIIGILLIACGILGLICITLAGKLRELRNAHRIEERYNQFKRLN